jgi:hypothetical protein
MIMAPCSDRGPNLVISTIIRIIKDMISFQIQGLPIGFIFSRPLESGVTALDLEQEGSIRLPLAC